mmetsp:Transcript_11580/g.19571  ORF Transcript_11580/g.19571 Transcript_11580/m.19571 type:complete len:227 (+) Transcript_11580:1072-1752(+)
MTGMSICLLLAYKRILAHELTIGDFAVFQMYINQLISPLQSLARFWKQIRMNWVDIELVLELLETHEQIEEVPDPRRLEVGAGKVEFKGVWFSYEKEKAPAERKYVLKDVSFEIGGGQSLGIVGQTGCGKSTLMRLLYRFVDVSKEDGRFLGQVLIDDQDIRQLRLADLRRHISIVPQDCVLFNETVAYNLAYGGTTYANDGVADSEEEQAKGELFRRYFEDQAKH